MSIFWFTQGEYFHGIVDIGVVGLVLLWLHDGEKETKVDGHED